MLNFRKELENRSLQVEISALGEEGTKTMLDL